MEYKDIHYRVDGPIAVVTFDRPKARNAHGWRLLDETDHAFERAGKDRSVRVVVMKGANGVFTTGHDLGSEDDLAYRESLALQPGVEMYDAFRRYNFDLILKWRNFPKPVIAMVEGFCIYGGWMAAAAADVVYAADNAEFLPGFLEYNSIPYDIPVKKAKEICFESRFLSAQEAHQLGFVNRVLPLADLERETFAYATRVAENSPTMLRFLKVQLNKAQDQMGYTRAVEDSFGDFLAMLYYARDEMRLESQKRLVTVDLALKHRKGERPGLKPKA